MLCTIFFNQNNYNYGNYETKHFTQKKVTAKEIADMLTSKLGEGYKVEFKPKANVGKQMIVGGTRTTYCVCKVIVAKV